MSNVFDMLRKFEGGVVVETWQKGNLWYRLWSDGWLEQGDSGDNAITLDTTITFPKAFRNADYALIGVGFLIAGFGMQGLNNKSPTAFGTYSGVSSSGTYSWYACGYAAE